MREATKKDARAATRASRNIINPRQDSKMNTSSIKSQVTPDIDTGTAFPASRFKDVGASTAELVREEGGRWRVGLDGTDKDLTPEQARILAAELVEAANGAAAMNLKEVGVPDIGIRDVLIIRDRFGKERTILADGHPHVVSRITSTDDEPEAEARYCVRPSLDADLSVTSRSDGYGKRKFTLTYTPLGRFELVMSDAVAGYLLLARVEGE